mgnify:CR=1 FL=1
MDKKSFLNMILQEFQNLIGMLGSFSIYLFESSFYWFQNLIGMLGRGIFLKTNIRLIQVSKPYRYARKEYLLNEIKKYRTGFKTL